MNRSAVSNIIKLKLNDVPILSARKTAKQQTIKALSTKSHEYPPLWRTTNPFIPLLSFSFVLQRLVSEKIHFKRNRIGVKWFHSNNNFKISRALRLPCCYRGQSDCRIFRIPPAHNQENNNNNNSNNNKTYYLRFHRVDWNGKILCLYGWHSLIAVFYVVLCLFIACVFVFFLSPFFFSPHLSTYSTSTWIYSFLQNFRLFL